MLATTLFAFGRTLLPYLRIAFAVVIAGMSIIHLFTGLTMNLIGISFLLAGVLPGVCDLRSFIRHRGDLAQKLARFASDDDENRSD